MTALDRRTETYLEGVLGEVLGECEASTAKHGDQGHLPDGTGPTAAAVAARDLAIADTDRAANRGEVTWRHILNEETREAYAEDDPAKLRRELVQVAAVATKWIEAIDRRGADG